MQSRLLGAVCAFALSAPTQAAIVLDQANVFIEPGGGLNGGSASFNWQQGVTVGLAGQLTSIDLYFNTAGNTDFLVNIGAAWQADTNDYFSNVSMVVGWNTIDVTSANILLNTGDKFVFGIHGTGDSFDPSFNSTTGNQYAAGELYEGGNIFLQTEGYDINFRTWMEVSAIPVPAAVWLFGSGLLGLVGMARRKKTT